jgi:hypothetical protein
MGVPHIATIAAKDTMREMVGNIVTMGNAVYPTPTVGGPLAPACYRVSFFAGSLEITARLKNTDDVELLVRVLEANRPCPENPSPLLEKKRPQVIGGGGG